MMNSLGLSEVTIKNFIPRGCVIHDTPYIIGIVIYVGADTKINQNSRKVVGKESWLMNEMNRVTYSVFAVQFVIVLVNTIMNTAWQNKTGYVSEYIENPELYSPAHMVTAFLVTLISYSHLIPISLYVAIEVMKFFLVYQIE